MDPTAVRRKAEAARRAGRLMMRSNDDQRRRALASITAQLTARSAEIATANAEDLTAGGDLDASLLGRLALPPAKLETVMEGCRQLAAMEDPLGATRRSTVLDDGLHLFQVTCPLGVVACIFESRPDVVVQIASLAIRTGNAVLLKGGKEAAASNRALANAVRAGLSDAGLPEDAVQLLEGREEVAALLEMDDLVDLVIPRGSGALVRHIKENTRISVMGHAEGICHVYIDEHADREKALRIAVDAKLDYPSACNAVETILVHRAHAGWIPDLVGTLTARGATVYQGGAADFAREYGTPEVNLAIVESIDDAMAHIAEFGSGHTEAIVTEDDASARRFLAGVDAAGVFVNASTRFADGFRYGLGAEVGISTGRIHARGPVGLDGLLSYRWLLVGDGQVAGEYSNGADAPRSFRHEASPTTWAEQWRALGGDTLEPVPMEGTA